LFVLAENVTLDDWFQFVRQLLYEIFVETLGYAADALDVAAEEIYVGVCLKTIERDSEAS
jgi:hypothetical protein